MSGCFFGHTWSPWTVTEEGKVTIEGRHVGWNLQQRRVCERCNKVDIDTKTSLIFPGHG